MQSLYFKQFCELEEKQPNYLTAIQDELGIDPKALEKNPEWAANISLGNLTYNGIMYKIVNFVYKHGNITGAMIQPMNIPGVKTQRSYLKHGDKQIKMPDSNVSTQVKYISIDELNDMLTQGMQPAPGGAGAGAGAGMLPGGGM
jgi:hypothetical protein